MDLNIVTLKQPSASTNPANQKGFIILDIDTSGLDIGIILGKALLKSRLKPLFNTAFKATSSNNPFSVRWFLFLIKL